MKKKKLHKLLAVFIIIGIFAGLAGLSLFFSQFSSEELQASILTQNKKIKVKHAKNKRRTADEIIKQLMVPPEILNPLTICTYTPPEKKEYAAEFIAANTQVWAALGGEFETAVYIKNTGNTSWFSDTSGCSGAAYTRLGTSKDQDRNSVFYYPKDPRWLGANRIAMVEPRVDPGEIATFSFTSKAPYVSDIFREYFQPLTENESWMTNSESAGSVDVYVGFVTADQEEKLRYVNKSLQTEAIDLSKNPVLHVDISEQKLRMQFGDTVVREYMVSTGTFKTPTPLGTFSILNKQDLRIGSKAPHYRMPQWQGITPSGVGFHSLPYLANDRGVFWKEALTHIGQRVSHGCVRLLPDDAKDLYALTEVGTPVVIHN